MFENKDESFSQEKFKRIEFIFFDKEDNLCYEKECKITTNSSKKLLIIKTINDSKIAPYKWKFVQKKNILFVFAIESLNDFALIFETKEECTKLLNRICSNNKNTKTSVSRKMLEKRFLFPIFNEIAKTDNLMLKGLIEKWLGNDENRMKEEYLKLVKDDVDTVISKKLQNSQQQQNITKFFTVSDSPKIQETEKEVMQILPERLNSSRKRTYSKAKEKCENTNDKELSVITDEINISDSEKENNEILCKIPKLFYATEHSITVPQNEFKLVYIKHKKLSRRGIIIFTTSKKDYCHEFGWNSTTQLFYCIGCRIKQKNHTAIMDLDRNEEFCIKSEVTPNDCFPKLYIPEDYKEIKIIKQGDYEILENCNEICEKYLIIFNPIDKTHCHEFQLHKSKEKFSCCECSNAMATVRFKDTVKEHVEMDLHSCKMIQYDPEKYYKYNEFVISPNFKIQNENGKNVLIIFDSNDRSLCYYYFKPMNSDNFICRGCNSKHQRFTSAKVLQNLEGEEYVILSNSKHVCSLRPYIPELKEIILRSPEFRYMEKTIFNAPKLFIFDKNDKSLCYIFTKCLNGATHRYFCTSCLYLFKEKKKSGLLDGENIKGMFKVKLCKNSDNGDYYVQMAENQKHICKPKKYEPEKYEVEKIIKESEFFLFKFKKNLNAAFYDPENPKLCYQYSYSKSTKYFTCVKCFKNHKHVSARIFKDKNDGKEYFKVKPTEHVCTPVKVASLKKSGIKILKQSSLNLEEEKAIKVDESKVVKMPDFELRDSETTTKKLIIFNPNDRTLCYEFSYSKPRNRYFCCECKRKGITVVAKMSIDENGNNCIILGERKHECNQIKYENEKISSNFIVLNDETNGKTKLVVFTSDDKDLCYIYQQKQKNLFRCNTCYKMEKNTVSAKLCKNENGEEYVHFLKTEHVCEPEKYSEEINQPKIIPESNFKLCNNKNGKPDSKLLIFEEGNNYVHEYFLLRKNQFNCNGCFSKGKQTSVKLCKDESNNGEKYIEISTKMEHICEPRKYDPENYNKGKPTLYNNFVLQHSAKSKYPKLIIFDENEKCFGYKFTFTKNCNTFICQQCKTRPVRAKLNINEENGKEYVELIHEHSCQKLNFNEKGIKVIDSSKFDIIKDNAGKKILVTSHPTRNERCYKFAFDEKMKTFCCIKCKKQKITAAIFKDQNDKEFVFLSNSHNCISFSKHFVFP